MGFAQNVTRVVLVSIGELQCVKVMTMAAGGVCYKCTCINFSGTSCLDAVAERTGEGELFLCGAQLVIPSPFVFLEYKGRVAVYDITFSRSDNDGICWQHL